MPRVADRELVAKGELTPRGRYGRASLDRDQVLKLRAEREERAREPKPPRQRKGWSEPPDAEHDWLTSVQAAELLGVSAVAVNKRCRGGRLPFVEKAGRRWFRRDHLELVKHADLVKRRPHVSSGLVASDADGPGEEEGQ